MKLTERQQELLAFVGKFAAERGYPPTVREIGAAMGIKSTNGVCEHLTALERKGYLRRAGFTPRGIVLTTPGQTELERRRDRLRDELAAIERRLTEVCNAA